MLRSPGLFTGARTQACVSPSGTRHSTLSSLQKGSMKSGSQERPRCGEPRPVGPRPGGVFFAAGHRLLLCAHAAPPLTRSPLCPELLHELKHDGFRMIARKEGDHVRLWSMNGRDWSAEFVAITAALRELPEDFVLDGEAVLHCSQGLPDFHGLLGRGGQRTACLYAFDLLHLRTTDLRPVELVGRRAMLARRVVAIGAAKRIGDTTCSGVRNSTG